jgi:plastocyanin
MSPRTPRPLRTRLAIGAVAVAALPLALAACGSSSKAAAGSSGSGGSSATKPAASSTAIPSTVHVTIQNFQFHPADFKIKPGGTIIVTNKDSVAHTFTDQADNSLFNTGDINPNQTKTIKAPTKPGSYPYICLIHQYMMGTVTVS